MPNKFSYLAKNTKGKTLHGEIVAKNIHIARFTLKKKGFTVINLNQKLDATAATQAGSRKKKRSKKLFGGDKVTLRDMVIFSRQFAAMIEAGIAMLRALTVLIDQTENEKLGTMLSEVKDDIEQGKALSESLANYPETFDRLYVAMVKAGEAGGVLDKVLNRLAGFLESRSKLTQKVKTAMTYPFVVVIIAVVVLWFMLTFILPKFSAIFESTGGELPAFTQALINLSEIVRSPWMLVIIATVWFTITSVQNWYKTEQGRLTLDRFSLKLPLFGDIIKKVAVARFARTFGTLIQSGVPMITALDVVKDSANNAILEGIILEVRKEVEEGGSLSTKLEQSDIFPPMVTQMIAIGEESGELETMLEKVADFYDTEVDNAVESLTSMMEPILIVVLGGLVGSVVVAMYLPIFNIIKQIQ